MLQLLKTLSLGILISVIDQERLRIEATPNVISFPVQPIFQLLLEKKVDRKLLEEIYSNHLDKKFPNDNSIYGTLHHTLFKDFPEIQNYLISHLNKPRKLYFPEEDEKFTQSVPLLQGLGTHYVTAWVGTPPQRKSVIVDTGSRFTSFPCTGCINCGEEHHTDKYFDPTRSKTFSIKNCLECPSDEYYCSENQCHFGVAYAEGSTWDAYLVQDYFFLGSNEPYAYLKPQDRDSSVLFTFGCQTYASGLFVEQHADGIIGMAAHDQSLHQAMYDQKKVSNKQFSLCFAWETHVSKEGVYAGVMTMGGSDDRLHKHDMVYAKSTEMKGFYTVWIRKIYLKEGGVGSTASARPISLKFSPLELNSGPGSIVDSGTTDIYFNTVIIDEFRSRWLQLSGQEFTDLPFSATEDDIKRLPSLIIQLSGTSANHGKDFLLANELDPQNPTDVLLEIPATYFIEYNPHIQKYASRLFFHEEQGVILGASSMRGLDIHFDWDNAQVGYAKSDCNYQQHIVNEEPIQKLKADSIPHYSTPLSNYHTDDSIHNQYAYTHQEQHQQTPYYNMAEDDLLGDDDIFLDDDYHDDEFTTDCRLGTPTLFSPCWESVDAMLCDDQHAEFDTVFQGLSTFRANIQVQPVGLTAYDCEMMGETLIDDVALIQCFNDEYCDIVTSCSTTCVEILSEGKIASDFGYGTTGVSGGGYYGGSSSESRSDYLYGTAGASQGSYSSTTKTVGFWGVTALLLVAIFSIGSSFIKDLSYSCRKCFKKDKSRGEYKALATSDFDDFEDDDDDDDDYEKKALYKKNRPNDEDLDRLIELGEIDKDSSPQLVDMKREELSLFDEILEDRPDFDAFPENTEEENKEEIKKKEKDRDEEEDSGDDDDEEEEDDDDDDDDKEENKKEEKLIDVQ